MDRRGQSGEGGGLQFIPGEEFELGLDPRGGLCSQPPEGDEALVLTSRRVVRVGRQDGRRTVMAAPLERVDAVEVRQAERSPRRLSWSLVLVVIGVTLSVFIWVVLDVPLLALLVGGVIAVVGIWLLLSYALVEADGQMCFLVGGEKICVPLYSRYSIQGAYQFLNRFFELAQQPRVAAPTEGQGWREVAAPSAPPGERKAPGAALEPMGNPVPAAPPSASPPPVQAQPDERAVLLEKLAGERTRLLGVVRGVPEDVAGRVPWEGEWSIKQNLAHVAEVERGFVAHVLRGAAGDTPEVGHPGQDQWTRGQEAANQRPLAEILEELARTREDTLMAVQGISDQALLTFRVRHRRMGELTLLQLLRVIYRHDRVHAEQGERALSPAP